MDDCMWMVSFTPWPLCHRGKTPCTHWTEGWVGPRTGLDDVEKGKFLTVMGLELRPRCPTCSQSLYRMCYPGSSCFLVFHFIQNNNPKRRCIFFKLYCHAEFEDPTWDGLLLTPTSQVCTAAIFVSMIRTSEYKGVRVTCNTMMFIPGLLKFHYSAQKILWHVGRWTHKYDNAVCPVFLKIYIKYAIKEATVDIIWYNF
jgi:hypothetical protein